MSACGLSVSLPKADVSRLRCNVVLCQLRHWPALSAGRTARIILRCSDASGCGGCERFWFLHNLRNIASRSFPSRHVEAGPLSCPPGAQLVAARSANCTHEFSISASTNSRTLASAWTQQSQCVGRSDGVHTLVQSLFSRLFVLAASVLLMVGALAQAAEPMAARATWLTGGLASSARRISSQCRFGPKRSMRRSCSAAQCR